MIKLVLLFSVLAFDALTSAASHNLHTHTQSGKERLEDGAFSPRSDHGHFDESEHHNEFDHEAILGSVKEAEEFHELSPDESKRRLRILVEKMDLNSDQYIDRHELKAWILRSFKKLSEEEAEDRFEDLDENNDDLISWEEYIKDVYGMEADGLKYNAIDDQEELKLIQDDKDMFAAADIDNDGSLSLDEHLKFHHPEEHPEMWPVILKQTLRDKDLNNDGIINFQEFVGDSGRNHDKEWLISEKDRFDVFDNDKDGFLNHNEILSWIIPSNEEVAIEETSHLFVAADEDHDDRLSYDEIIDKYDIFVGSEATDYGDHLQNIEEFHDEL